MSDNPYSGTYHAEIYTEPERTSVAAVFSLVCSLVCCIPGVSLLGAVLGLVALLGIGRSRGRVGGRGLAIAGIILGLLFTMLWVGIAVGVNSGLKEYVRNMQPAIGGIYGDLDAGRYDAVRTALGGPAASATDAELAAFHAAYEPSTGQYVGPAARTVSELFGVVGSFGQSFQSLQGRPNYIPAFLTFDQGPVLVAVQFDPGRPRPDRGPIGELMITDLWVVGPDGTVHELSDYVTSRPAAGGATPAADTPDPDPDADAELPEPGGAGEP